MASGFLYLNLRVAYTPCEPFELPQATALIKDLSNTVNTRNIVIYLRSGIAPINA